MGEAMKTLLVAAFGLAVIIIFRQQAALKRELRESREGWIHLMTDEHSSECLHPEALDALRAGTVESLAEILRLDDRLKGRQLI